MSVADLRGLRRTLYARHPVKPRIYWTELSICLAIGWPAFIGVACAPPAVSVALFPVAVFALLRAAYFVHEIAHVRRSLPGIELVWNVVIGIPVLLPSFMSEAHANHHRPSTFGTADDPEYEPVATWSRARFVASVALPLLLPPLLVLRFALLGPLSLMVPPLRRTVFGRLSTLATNAGFVRDMRDAYAPRVIVQELLASAFTCSTAAALVLGHLPVRVGVAWWAVVGVAAALNQLRTNYAHVYQSGGARSTFEEQIADSLTVDGGGWWWDAFFPVGTRYHAMHHLAPNLPYHALPAAHRELLEACEHPAYLASRFARPMDAFAQLRVRRRDLT